MRSVESKVFVVYIERKNVAKNVVISGESPFLKPLFDTDFVCHVYIAFVFVGKRSVAILTGKSLSMMHCGYIPRGRNRAVGAQGVPASEK